VLPGDVPDDLPETHDRTGSQHRANRLVLGEHAVRVRDHDNSAARHRAGEAHCAATSGEDGLARAGGQIDATVSYGIDRRRRLEPPDDSKHNDRRLVHAHRGSAGAGSDAAWRSISRSGRRQGGRQRRSH
jgi:hypothetical protein